jgi:hypothetical protein
MKKNKLVIGFTSTALALIALVASAASTLYSIDTVDPTGKKSIYTSQLPKLLGHWPLEVHSIKDPRPAFIRAIKTTGKPYFIGMVKYVTIQAPLSRVAEVCEKVEDYPKIWEDVLEVSVESRDQNKAVTVWTRKAPTFFMPKIHYRVIVTTDKSTPDRIVYKQQLLDGNSMNTSDALVVLEKIKPELTRVTVVNFFDADFGPFKGLIEGVIWKKSMENGFKDDIALRAHVEHPDWTLDQVTKESEQTLDRFPIKDVEYTDSIHFE